MFSRPLVIFKKQPGNKSRLQILAYGILISAADLADSSRVIVTEKAASLHTVPSVLGATRSVVVLLRAFDGGTWKKRTHFPDYLDYSAQSIRVGLLTPTHTRHGRARTFRDTHSRTHVRALCCDTAHSCIACRIKAIRTLQCILSLALSPSLFRSLAHGHSWACASTLRHMLARRFFIKLYRQIC